MVKRAEQARRPEAIALFDMDGTLCDFSGKLRQDMARLRRPGEAEFACELRDAPPQLKERAERILADAEWWATLPRLQLGWDIWGIAGELGIRRMILTQAPSRNPNAWLGKKLWLDRHIGPEADVTMTRDKGLVYGTMLTDDYPRYAVRWLEWRRNGLVIMPANESNREFVHPQVIRYDGRNIEEVRERMEARLEAAMTQVQRYEEI